MLLTRMLRLSLVAVFAMACGDAVSPPLRGLTYAAATFACGPADGPAVAIYLAQSPVGSLEPSTPFVRVYVPVELDQLAGRAWPVFAGKSEAGAWFHPNESTYELAETGYMIVSSVDSDKTIEGSVDLQFPDSGHIKTRFRATWVPTTTLCG
jgi:hypothetical protein